MLMVEDHDAGLGDSLVCDLRSPCLFAAMRALDHATQSSPEMASARALVRDLARLTNAIDLRIARYAAWLKTQDLSPLGVPSWSVFCKTWLDLNLSWTNSLIRLLQSRLDLVKQAVSRKIITLTEAIKAPGHVAVEDQEAWLAHMVLDDEPTDGIDEDLRDRSDLDLIFGVDAECVSKARSLAALCLGVKGPNRRLDRYIFECWMNEKPGEAILREAREPPPKPDLSPPTWCDEPDPATAILGPWEEPTSVDHGMRLLAQAQHLRRERAGALGMMLWVLKFVFVCLDWGFDSFQEYVEKELGMSMRSAQRHQKRGHCLDGFKDLRDAVSNGLDLDRAEAIGLLCEADNLLRKWLTIVPHLPRGEARLLDERSRDLSVTNLRGRYEKLVADAPELVKRAMAATENGDSPSGLGTTDPAHIGVALPPESPEERRSRQPSYMRVHPRLLDASKWFVKTVKIPKETGFRKILDVQHHTCQNPECQKRWISNHAHHDQERSRGGSDDPLANGRTLCKSCHLRLRHSGKLAIVKLDDKVVYLYPGRAIVVG